MGPEPIRVFIVVKDGISSVHKAPTDVEVHFLDFDIDKALLNVGSEKALENNFCFCGVGDEPHYHKVMVNGKVTWNLGPTG